MLPYVRTQLVDVALSGALSALAWWACGLGLRLWSGRATRRASPAARATPSLAPLLTLRLVLLAVAVVPAAIFAWKLLVEAIGLRVYRGFFAIALAFYAGVLWFPLFALLTAWLARPRPRDARWAVPLALLAPLVGAWALFVEPDRLQVRHERIEVPQWPRGTGLRIVHLSDLQTIGGDVPRERRALALVRGLAPDLIVFTGDYASGPYDDPEPALAAARAFVADLAAPHGVVLVAGHSETEAQRELILAGLDVVYLKNEEHAFLRAGAGRVSVVGLEPWKPVLNALARPKAPDELRIVVSHVPDVTARLEGHDVDLHLAGHMHGGQVVVPGFGPPITLSDMPRRYARGLFRHGDHWLNVCAGLGMEGGHAPRIRLFCPPEICVIELAGGG